MKALYVTDRADVGQERLEAVLGALSGAPGICVQLREKEATDHEILLRARRARELLGLQVPLFINRRFDLALAAEADGVHLPAEGLPVRRVKVNTPRGFRVGVSTHSAQEAAWAIEEGADLVVIGPIFDTPSKRAFGPPLGSRLLEKLPPSCEHEAEVYAIGGIDETTVQELLPWRDRLSGVAAVRLFQRAQNPRAVLEVIRSL